MKHYIVRKSHNRRNGAKRTDVFIVSSNFTTIS